MTYDIHQKKQIIMDLVIAVTAIIRAFGQQNIGSNMTNMTNVHRACDNLEYKISKLIDDAEAGKFGP